nr:Monocarboxylate transporter 6 like [Ipomoea batatas]
MTTVALLSTTPLTRPPKFFLLRGTQNFFAHIKTTKWPHGSIKLGSLRRRDKLVKFRGLNSKRGKVLLAAKSGGSDDGSILEKHDNVQRRRLIQTILWIAEGVYVLWLFLLPYAPGDPVWRISSATVNDLLGLSLNFFFILPISNIVVGIHFLEAPVLHPMSEGLFNFVIGWTFMFAPLLFTDRKRDRYKGSLDVLWGFQMFLTNSKFSLKLKGLFCWTNDDDPRKTTSQLGSVMTSGARIVGLIGVGVCLLSTFWAIFGRGDGNFGGISERWEFLVSYLGSERLAYAFIWDICLYMIFQPWLIGDNLQNIEKDKVGVVNYLRFVPVVGLAAYCLCLNLDDN